MSGYQYLQKRKLLIEIKKKKKTNKQVKHIWTLKGTTLIKIILIGKVEERRERG